MLGLSFEQEETASVGLSLSELTTHVTPFHELWESVTTWRRYQPEWIDGPFIVLDADHVAEYIRQCWRDMYRLIRVFDADLFDEPVKVGNRLKKAVEEFKMYLPLITKLRNEDLRPRHWSEVSKELGVHFRVDHSLTLRILLANGSIEAMETISDISQTATLEVRFERGLDQLEAAWEVSGKPGDLPIWEIEERDRARMIEQEEKRRREEEMRNKQEKKKLQKDMKTSVTNSSKESSPPSSPLSSSSSSSSSSTHVNQFKLPPQPPPPICEAMYVTFVPIERLNAHALENPEELARVLEDHVTTTTKLMSSPYALPFASRVRDLRDQQNKFMDLLFSWMEMQRIWLELRPLYDQGRMDRIPGQSDMKDLYGKCDSRIRKTVAQWYSENVDEHHEQWPPSPLSMMKTSKILQRVRALSTTLQGIKADLSKHLRDSFWTAAPRTRWLDMDQIFRLNALEFYPDDMDHMVPLLFPGARRWLIEPENKLKGTEEEEDPESDDTEEDEEGRPLVKKNNNPDDDEDEEDEEDNTVVSGQYFRNLMQEVHVLPASTLCGFGTTQHHQNHHGADGFYFGSPIQLFTNRKKLSSEKTVVRTPRPLATWLKEAELQMRRTLLDRVKHAYEVCSVFHGNNLASEAGDAFYAWLQEQGVQALVLAMRIMYTQEIEQMFRIQSSSSGSDKSGGDSSSSSGGGVASALASMARTAAKHLEIVSKWIKSKRQAGRGGGGQRSNSRKGKRPSTAREREKEKATTETLLAYVSVLVDQRDLCDRMSVRMSDVYKNYDPLESFEWMSTLRHYLVASRSDDVRPKADATEQQAIGQYRTPHAWLSPTEMTSSSAAVVSAITAVSRSSSSSSSVSSAPSTTTSSSSSSSSSPSSSITSTTKGPQPFFKQKLQHTIEVSSANVTFRHALEYYGHQEWRISTTPLTDRVMRAAFLAHRDGTNLCLFSSKSPTVACETMDSVAREMGMPFHRVCLVGGGGSRLRMEEEIVRAVATGHRVHVTDVHRLTSGMLSLLTTMLLALDHARKANISSVCVGGSHRTEVVSSWSLSVGMVGSPSFLSSQQRLFPTTFTTAFRPVDVSRPDCRPIVEALILGAGLFEDVGLAASFARRVTTVVEECRTSGIGTMSSYRASLSLVRSAVSRAVDLQQQRSRRDGSDAETTKMLSSSVRSLFLATNGGGRKEDLALFSNLLDEVFGEIEEESNGSDAAENVAKNVAENVAENQPEEDKYLLLLSKELVFAFEREKCVPTPAAMHYALLLWETLRKSEGNHRSSHRGVLLVGPSGVGKSVVTRALASAMSRVDAAIFLREKSGGSGNGMSNKSKKNLQSQHDNSDTDTDSDHEAEKAANIDLALNHEARRQEVEIVRLNPNSVERHEWRGCYHPLTGMWRDGLMKTTLRRLQEDRFGPRGLHFKHSHSQRWLVLDGATSSSTTMSSNWFDDILPLLRYGGDGRTSPWTDCRGGTIVSNSQLRVIVETDSLDHLSPSQLPLSVVHCSATGIEWQALVTAWLVELRVSHPSLRRSLGELTGMLALLLPMLIKYLQEEYYAHSNTAATRFVSNLLRHLESSLTSFRPLSGNQLSRRVEREAKRLKRQASLSLITAMKKPVAEEWDMPTSRKHVQGICLSTVLSTVAVYFSSDLHPEISERIEKTIRTRSEHDNTGVSGRIQKYQHHQNLQNEDNSWRAKWMENRLTELLVQLPKTGKDETGRQLLPLDFCYSLEDGKFHRWTSDAIEKHYQVHLSQGGGSKRRTREKETSAALEQLYDSEPASMYAGDIIVPTDSLSRSTLLCATSITSGRSSVVVLGEVGTGKTLLLRRVRDCLEETIVDQVVLGGGSRSSTGSTGSGGSGGLLASYVAASRETQHLTWSSTKEICLVVIDDVALDDNGREKSLLFQIHDQSTFHADLESGASGHRASGGGGGSSAAADKCLVPTVETHHIEGARVLLSCDQRKVENAIGRRIRRHLMEFRTTVWDRGAMESILLGVTSHFVDRNGSHALSDLLPSIIGATASLVSWCASRCPTTPLTTFGYRDASRIVQSLLSIEEQSLLAGGVDLRGRLWLHEIECELETKIMTSGELVSEFRDQTRQVYLRTFGNATNSSSAASAASGAGGAGGAEEGGVETTTTTVLDEHGRSWPTTFAETIGLLQLDEDGRPLQVSPLIFTTISSSGQLQGYSERRNGWGALQTKCISILKKEEREMLEIETEAAEDRGEERFHKGLRGCCPGTYSHALLGRPVLETVKNIVRVLLRPLKSSFIYVGSPRSGKRTCLELACKVTNATMRSVSSVETFREEMAEAVRLAVKGRRVVVVLPTLHEEEQSDGSKRRSMLIKTKEEKRKKKKKQNESKEEEKEKEKEGEKKGEGGVGTTTTTPTSTSTTTTTTTTTEDNNAVVEQQENQQDVSLATLSQQDMLHEMMLLTENITSSDYCLSLLRPTEARLLLEQHAASASETASRLAIGVLLRTNLHLVLPIDARPVSTTSITTEASLSSIFAATPSLPSRLSVVTCSSWREKDYLPLTNAVAEELQEDLEWNDDETSSVVRVLNKVAASVDKTMGGMSEVQRHTKFVMMFQRLLMEKNRRERDRHDRLVIAIEELDDSAEFVATLKEELDGMKPVLDRKNKSADLVMKEAKMKRKELQSQMDMIKNEEILVERTISEIKELELKCKEALALAMPPLEKALKVIKSLKKQDLDEVKSMKNPPSKVKVRCLRSFVFRILLIFVFFFSPHFF